MTKKIVVCCDGTSNEYGADNTNVVSVFEAIVRDKDQIGFYDPGVGTFDPLGRFMGKWVGKLMGDAFGWGMQQNIEDAYEYLMNHYEPEDELYLFGFSRGAFTVRSLAGMLHKCGLLQKGSKNLIPYASAMYNTPDNDAIATGFKDTFCQPCKPFFIGVWDTVASLGYLFGRFGRRFFDATLHGDTPYGYHAISIDEQRKKFLPSIWDEERVAAGQTVEQVWFPGVHCDVGGSYPERGLSDGALVWMLRHAEDAGLRLKPGWEDGPAPDPTDKKAMHQSRKGGWRVWRKVHRHIPEGSKIHVSAMDRMNADVDYRPRNLPASLVVIDQDDGTNAA